MWDNYCDFSSPLIPTNPNTNSSLIVYRATGRGRTERAGRGQRGKKKKKKMAIEMRMMMKEELRLTP
jgi:ribosomal protein L15